VTRDPADSAALTARDMPRAANGWIAVQFVLAGIIWGSSFHFMKVARGGLSPAQVVWSRLVSLAYMRRFVGQTGMSSLVFSFLNIGIAAAIMVVLTPVLVLTPVRLDAAIIACVLLLGCLGTGIAYIWNQNTLRAWGPTRASTVTYITPVVGVVLGVVLLGEPITWNEPAGALVVFLGILLAQGRVRWFAARGGFGPADD